MRDARSAEWMPPQARAQMFLFTARQALDAGMTAGQVRHRLRTGTWLVVAGRTLRHREHIGDRYDDVVAAHLTWPDAVACLHSAARAHGLPVTSDGTVRAVVPHRRRPQHQLQPYRFALPAADVVTAGPFALTSLRRTVLDCLGLLPRREAEALLVWVLTRRIVSHDALVAMVDRRQWSTGNVQRRALLDETRGGALSAAERRVHRILRAAQITGWRADQTVHDALGVIGTVDVLFPVERLVIEVDGMAYHGQERFQSDRTRQNRLVNAGYVVLRFTWADAVDRPDTVRRQTLAALDRRRRDRTDW